MDLNRVRSVLKGHVSLETPGKYLDRLEWRWPDRVLSASDAALVQRYVLERTDYVVEHAEVGTNPEGVPGVRALGFLRVTNRPEDRQGGGKGVVPFGASSGAMPNSGASSGASVSSTGASSTALSSSAMAMHEVVAAALVAQWTTLFGKPARVTKAALSRVEALLAEGYTAEQLATCVYLAHSRPGCIPGRPLPRLDTILRSEARVRELLGLPEKPKATWMTPFEEAYLKRYPDGTLNFGALAGPLRKAVLAKGDAFVLAEFESYLDVTALMYLNWHKFVAGLGSWRRARSADRRASDLLPDQPTTTVRF